MSNEKTEQNPLLTTFKVGVTGYHAYEAQRFFRAVPPSRGKAGLLATAALIGAYEIGKEVQNINLKK